MVSFSFSPLSIRVFINVSIYLFIHLSISLSLFLSFSLETPRFCQYGGARARALADVCRLKKRIRDHAQRTGNCPHSARRHGGWTDERTDWPGERFRNRSSFRTGRRQINSGFTVDKMKILFLIFKNPFFFKSIYLSNEREMEVYLYNFIIVKISLNKIGAQNQKQAFCAFLHY